MSISKNNKLELLKATKKVDALFSFVSKISYANEVWKELNPPDGKYFLSTYGRLISLCRDTPILKKQEPNNKGYMRVYINGQKYFVHRLVAQLFIKNPENKPIVHHKNLNNKDNRYTNLIWATEEEHRELHKQSKNIQKKENQNGS